MSSAAWVLDELCPGGIKISVKEEVGVSWASSGPHQPVIQLEWGRQRNRVNIGYNRRKLKQNEVRDG